MFHSPFLFLNSNAILGRFYYYILKWWVMQSLLFSVELSWYYLLLLLVMHFKKNVYLIHISFLFDAGLSFFVVVKMDCANITIEWCIRVSLFLWMYKRMLYKVIHIPDGSFFLKKKSYMYSLGFGRKQWSCVLCIRLCSSVHIRIYHSQRFNYRLSTGKKPRARRIVCSKVIKGCVFLLRLKVTFKTYSILFGSRITSSRHLKFCYYVVSLYCL